MARAVTIKRPAVTKELARRGLDTEGVDDDLKKRLLENMELQFSYGYVYEGGRRLRQRWTRAALPFRAAILVRVEMLHTNENG